MWCDCFALDRGFTCRECPSGADHGFLVGLTSYETCNVGNNRSAAAPDICIGKTIANVSTLVRAAIAVKYRLTNAI
jgi:hypothetical protein